MVPSIVPEIKGIKQIHSSAYRNHEELPKGNVLVVGAGSSGAQITAELMKTERRTFFLWGLTIDRRAVTATETSAGGLVS